MESSSSASAPSRGHRVRVRRVERALPYVLGLAAALAMSSPARGDWPSSRHDQQRTAVASGLSNITAPAPYWRFFHGGTIASTNLLVRDVDGDLTPEVILCTPSGVSARRIGNGDFVWKSLPLSCQRFVSFSDLDGDGEPELLAHTTQQLVVVRPSDGAVLWQEPLGEMGTLSSVRVGDLSGDGVDDVVMHECGCCSVNSGKTSFAYRFAGPDASVTAPKFLWTAPSIACGGSRSATVVAMRAPGVVDFTLGKSDRLELLDGKTGAVVAATPALGVNVQASQCTPVNVDETPEQELLCVLIDASAGGRRLYLMRYEDAPTPALVVAWQALVGTTDGAVTVPPSMLADLDGDGKLEVTLAGRDAQGSETTFVYDARVGTELASLPAHIVVGTLPVPGSRAHLLTRKDGDLYAWSFDPGRAPSLAPLWSLADRGAVGFVDLEAGEKSLLAARILTHDFDGDGVGELATSSPSGDRLELVNAESGNVLANYEPPAGAALLAAWSFALPGGEVSLGVAQSDGNFHLLDASLAPLSGNKEFGVRFGGYFSSSQFRLLRETPVLADLADGGPPGLVVATSRGELVRLDATKATNALGPSVVWGLPSTAAAVIVPGLGIAAVERKPGKDDLVKRVLPDGSLVWQREVGGVVFADMTHADLDGDGIEDLVVEHGVLSDLIEHVTALSGADGSTLWEAAPLGPGNRQPAGGAMADWNGDGVADFVFQFSGTRVLDGTSGAVIASSPPGGPYNMPILLDVDGDGLDEATLYAGYEAAGTLTHDLSSFVWKGVPDDRPLTYGAMVRCEEGARLLGGTWAYPARLNRILTSGPSAGANDLRVLAGGAVYLDEASATAAGARMGQLGSPSVHENLAGDSRAILVVGSTDGWLYGLDACSGELRFTYEIGAPVGSVVFGDSDGDGLDELLASVADGYLYAFRQSPVPAVGEVLDTDPPAGFDKADVDAIVTRDTLHAAWSEVPGAEGYEVAVVRDLVDGGGFVTAEPWRDVGDVTTATVEGLVLDEGKRYFFAVRARQGALRSPDTLSDGVVVSLAVPPPTEEPDKPGRPAPVWLVGRSCVYACAVSTQADRRGSWPLLALGLTLVARRLGRTSRRGSRSVAFRGSSVQRPSQRSLQK